LTPDFLPVVAMHIVHLMASPFVGGPERQVLGLARHLPSTFRTTFLSFAERGLAQPFIDEARRQGITANLLRHNVPRLVACVREVTGELRRLRADVLCCSGYKPDLIGWRAARHAGIPVVSISHGWTAMTLRVRFYEWLDRMALRWMDAVVCVSAAQADKVRRAGVREHRLAVITNAIGAEAFASPDPAYREMLYKMFPTKPAHVVGAAGRFSPEKNFALFIEAALQVVALRPDVGFVLFGDGPLRAKLTAQVARLGLADRLILPGFRADVSKYLPHLDLAVLSSTTEGLPVVMLEVLAAGVPMVATSVGGVGEVLEDGKSGYVVPSGDVTALAGRIIELLADDTGRRAMGRYAQAHVRRHFSFERQATQYQELFARLLAK
jgi:glycosyltransferase involved in cell wall biosynthesis